MRFAFLARPASPPLDAICEAIWCAEGQVPYAACEASGLLWRLMHPLIVVLMRRHDAPQLQRFKEMMAAPNR